MDLYVSAVSDFICPHHNRTFNLKLALYEFTTANTFCKIQTFHCNYRNNWSAVKSTTSNVCPVRYNVVEMLSARLAIACGATPYSQTIYACVRQDQFLPLENKGDLSSTALAPGM